MGRLLRRLWGSQDATGSLPPLRDTGERVIPEESGKGFGRVNPVRHRVAHLHAIRRLKGSRRVLEVGCGTGYGSAMVAPHVGEVVGIDSSDEAVARVRASNRLDTVEFVAMPATALGDRSGGPSSSPRKAARPTIALNQSSSGLSHQRRTSCGGSISLRSQVRTSANPAPHPPQLDNPAMRS